MSLTRRALIRTAGLAATSAIAAPRRGSAAGRIVYWSHNYPSLVDIVSRQMAPGFAKQSGTEIAYSDFDTSQLETKILTGWSGGEGGPDLVSVGDQNLANYVYRKLAAPVDPAAFGFSSLQDLIAAYQPGSLDGFIFGGQLYAIPMDVASISMYYRKDFFREAGLDPDRPPTTWEEVADIGPRLVRRDAGGNITRAGWGWEARTPPSHFYYWGVLLPQKGADFLNKDGKCNGLDNPGGLQAFQYLHDSYHGAKPFAALGLAPVISPIDDFGAGRVAMINSGFWLAPALEKKYPHVTYKDDVYGVARLPQFAQGRRVTRLNPWVWVVSAKSPVRRQAWEFVAYMTKPAKNQEIWAREAQYIQPWKGFETRTGLGDVPYANVFFEDLKIGIPGPRTPKFNRLSALVARAYDQISADGMRPDKVVPALAKGIDRMLED